MLGWAGLSVHCQTLSFLGGSELSARTYLAGKVLHGVFSALLVGGPGGPGFSHLTVLYTHEGYDSSLVAALMSYAGFAIFLGKIICGQAYDRLGSRRGNYYIFGTTLLGLLLCCLAPVDSSILPFLAITMMGLGLPVSAVSPTSTTLSFFR